MKKLLSLFKKRRQSDFSTIKDSDLVMLARTEFKNDYQYAYFWMKNTGEMPKYGKYTGEV